MRRQKIILKLAFAFFVLSIINTTAYASLQEGNGDLFVSTSMKIPEGINILINGGLNVENQDFHLDGKISFINKIDVNSYFVSGINVNGGLAFEGIGDHNLVIDGDLQLGYLVMNTSGLLQLSGDLKVNKSLFLQEGLIVTKNSGLIIIESDEEESLIIDESSDDESYIVGLMARAVKPNSNYYFPIGDYDNKAPVFLLDIENRDVVVVEFDSDLTDNIKNYSQVSYPFIKDKGWIVSSNNLNDNRFKLSLFVDEIENPLDGYGIVRAEINDYSDLTVDYNTVYGLNGYIRNIDKVQYGAFVIAESEKVNLPNFLFVGNSEESRRFKVPNADRYTNVKLVVFDRMGKEVYRNLNYYNGFSATNYSSGTYFYELTLLEGSKEKKIYNFIEIKHGK